MVLLLQTYSPPGEVIAYLILIVACCQDDVRRYNMPEPARGLLLRMSDMIFMLRLAKKNFAEKWIV